VIKQKKNPYSFTTVVVLLLIVSFFSAHLILKFTGQKEEESRKIFAQKLAAEQDPLAEHLFAEVEASISTDTSLISLLTKKLSYGNTVLQQHAQVPVITNELFKRKLIAKYFSGYWEKYEIHITVFDTSCFAILPNPLPEKNNIAYFEDVISSEGTPTESSNLFYLQNSSCRLSYLARLPLVSLQDSSMRVGNLFIEFDSRIISEEAGFPELMLDRKIGVETELGKDYSYAKYKDGELLFYHGKFPYSLSAESFLQDGSNEKKFPHFRLLQINNYNHLIYMPDSSSMVVVSKKEEGILASITAFSYLFAFFSLFLMLLLLLRLLVSHSKIHIYSFSNRIQFALVSIILFSLLFFSAGTVFYIQQQYDRQSRQSVRDKMVSALVEASQELGSEEKLQLSKSEFFSYTLKRMSNIFLSDLNLYDKEGNLIASSQKKLFDEGLLSHKMNPQSYYHLVVKQDIDFVQEEKIGRLKYLSAYSSLRNDSGELLGYLNIPYFARQSELEKEISTILSTIINIYVLLFVISIILALALSEYFTRPLKLIQEKLGKIKLGKANEPIEWKSQDEIGSLVNEYNRMIEELHKSAMLLAKSERESAWREMAKQVAHEIKNPLTPMKLSIQHLQRIWKNKDENMDEKIQQLTQTIVEQIEALSVIASEFASFAKMPVTVNEKINLKTILENAIALFRDSTDAEISFHTVQDEAFIYADKEQMLRVCNNLLKNALQAIPENKHGKIDVSLEKKDNAFLFKVKDNGIGISEEQISKIFTPNFTTKSGGMGLGLAMVKSIVETFGGKIWFETSRGKGTTFFVSLHEYKDNS
jgi:signal transduction histidine kinase